MLLALVDAVHMNHRLPPNHKDTRWHIAEKTTTAVMEEKVCATKTDTLEDEKEEELMTASRKYDGERLERGY